MLPIPTRRLLISTASAAAVAAAGGLAAASAVADETCQSPYMAKITGEEEYVYVWTLGIEGVGDGSDKVVTIDVRSGSPTFGQVVDVDSVGGRHEAHHGGLTDDRRHLWLQGLDTSMIFIFDIATDPSNPRLVKTIDDFVEASGGRGRAARRLCPSRAHADLRPLQYRRHRSHGAGGVRQ